MMKYATRIAAAFALLLLSACNGETINGETGNVGDTAPLAFQVPARIRQTSAVDPTQLSLQLMVDGQTYAAQRQPNGSYVARVTVDANQESSITVVWTEVVEGVALRLAEWSQVVQVGNSDDTIDVASSAYTTEGEGFDNDGDGISNLDERIADTDPLVANAVLLSLFIDPPNSEFSSIDMAQLNLQLAVNDLLTAAVRQPDGRYIARVSVAVNSENRISLVWTENFDGVQLKLAEWSGVEVVDTSDKPVNITVGMYTSEGDGFDIDGDGFSNLEERNENSSPLNANDRPGAAVLSLRVSLPDDIVLLGDIVELSATVNNESIDIQRVTTGVATATVPGLSSSNQTNVSVQITSGGLPLASAQLVVNLQAGDNNEQVLQTDFDASADADDDGLTNVVELLRGTDPRSPIDYRIDRVSLGPRIDGSLRDEVWLDRLQRVDALRVNRLIVADSGQDQITTDGLFSTWAAVTDGETLFIAVRIIDNDIRFDSDDQWWNDDSVELLIDGDNSKQTGSYDDENDYHIGFRAVDQQAFRGANSLELPDDLIYELSTSRFNFDIITDAFESDLNQDGNTDDGFNLEIAISLDDLDIELGEPFGINVHYDDDDNGGVRDAKYTWTGQFGMDIDYLEPSALGTALIND